MNTFVIVLTAALIGMTIFAISANGNRLSMTFTAPCDLGPSDIQKKMTESNQIPSYVAMINEDRQLTITKNSEGDWQAWVLDYQDGAACQVFKGIEFKPIAQNFE